MGKSFDPTATIERLELLVRALDENGLVVVERLKSFLSDAVVRVEDSTGQRFVVKFMGQSELLDPEYETMAAFADQDAAPAVKRLSHWVMQMQDMGAIELYDEPERSWLEPVAQMLKRAHQSEIPDGALLLSDSVIEIYQQRMRESDHLSPVLLAQVESLRPRLESGLAIRQLIHADLHIKNIMKTQEGPRLIDPYGRIGPAIYDLATIACSWPEQKREVFDELLSLYPEAGHAVDVEAWYAWTLIYRLYNAYHNAFPPQALEEAVAALP